MPTAHQLFFAARRDLDVFRSEFPEGKTSDHDAIDWFSEGRPREVADADDEEDAWARYWALVCQIDEHGLAIEITDEERSELERIKAQGSYDMGENGVAHCRFRDRWMLTARYPATHYTRWYDSEVAAMSELRLWADEPHATECEILDRPAVDITPPGCTRSYVIAMPVSEWLAPARAA